MSGVPVTVASLLRAVAEAGRPVAFQPSFLDDIASSLEAADAIRNEAAASRAAAWRLYDQAEHDRKLARNLNTAAGKRCAKAARDRRACWWLVAMQAVLFAATVAIWVWGR